MTAGTYGGGTYGWPWGGGLGLYFDNRGRIYPQLYAGSPGVSFSAGYTPDLEGLLTGPSFAGSVGRGNVGFNAGGSGGASGFGIGTPGVGVTHGYGPYELSDDFSRPWARSQIRDSATAAGVPSRNNVFEYGFPGPASARPSTAQGELKGAGYPPSVFETGAAPTPYVFPALPNAPRGLPGMIAEAGPGWPANPDWQPAGGLAGRIQELLRDKALRND